jgi:hypothetical protein
VNPDRPLNIVPAPGWPVRINENVDPTMDMVEVRIRPDQEAKVLIPLEAAGDKEYVAEAVRYATANLANRVIRQFQEVLK